jgi:hypothetical protein
MLFEVILEILKKQVVCENRLIFEFQIGQVACENRPISGKYECLLKFFLKFKKGRSPMKIGQLLNYKMERSPMKIDKFRGSNDAC